MKVVLLNACAVTPPRDHVQRTLPHLRTGVASIAAEARRRGHAVRILDPVTAGLSLDAFLDDILSGGPDVVGLSAFTEEVEDAGLIAEEIKRRAPQVRVVIGGYHASAVPERTLEEFPAFDAAVIGEGEIAFCEMLARADWEKVAGLAVRHPDGSVVRTAARRDLPDMDALEFPAWELADASRYMGRIPVETSRTCPFGCSFCYQATDPKVRYKSPERVVDEVELAVRVHGAREISFFSAGSFPLSRKHGEAVCRGLLARGLRVPWLTGTRADLVDPELLALMKESGCAYISLGIETGDEAVLRECRKGVTLERVETALRQIHEAGIESEMCFILGLPGDTPATLRRTARFAARMGRYAELANFAILTPFPGSRIYEDAVAGRGDIRITGAPWCDYSKHGGLAARHKAFAPGQLRRAQLAMYLRFYLGNPVKLARLLRSRNFREILTLRRVLALLGRIA